MNQADKAISFVPSPLLALITAGKLEHRFYCVVAFADVSGFTKMSEQLSTIGREGAEALTAILNSYFTAMISRIEESGGFVGKFGGDAMTIFFPAESEADLNKIAKIAVSTSIDLQRKMDDFQDVKTKAGSFSLGMKIGIASGQVLFRVVGPDEDGGREYLLAGYPLDEAAKAEHHGTSGEVVISSAVASQCQLEGVDKGEGFVGLNTATELSMIQDNPPSIQVDKGWTDISRTFIDPAVYNRMALGIDSVGEIRKVSVIFLSFSGLDYDADESVGDKLDEFYKWIYVVTQRFGGSISKVDMGDKGSKMILTFGTPSAHENDEELSVHCALELVNGRERMAILGIETRMGVASGVVFAGEVGAPSRQEYTVMGSVVNLSARLMAYSKPGQLLVDEVTKSRSEKRFNFSEPEHVRFKGIGEPIPVYGVEGLKIESDDDAESSLHIERVHTNMVGREQAFEQSINILDSLAKHGLHTLIIKGDPGIGKSRLSQAILDETRNRNYYISAGEALSYAKQTPYLIWISIIRKLMKLPSAGGGDDAVSKIEKIVNEADPGNIFRVPIMASMLGIECEENDITKNFDGQLRQENLFDFFVQYFTYLAKLHPLTLLFEDSQWIDRSSLSLIAYLMRNLSNLPILLLIARRPYSRNFSSKNIQEIENSDKTTHISLKELSQADSERLILNNLAGDVIDQELMNFIFESSQGNPSFTEQLVENLKSLKRIKITPASDDSGVFIEGVGDLSDIDVPDSLSSLIMSQLDRLKPEAKLTVKVAAVVGRQFQDEVIQRSYPVKMDKQQILDSLSDLKSNDIIDSVGGDDIYDYIFKNLLTRDVAYDSLLFSHRREYHRRIGICIEDIYSVSLTEWYEELARHFDQSEDDGRAVNYLGKAGDKAYDLYANESADDYYTRALKRADAETDPDNRYKILNMRSKVYAIIGLGDKQKSDLDEMIELAGKRGDLKGKVSTYSNLARYYTRIRDLDNTKTVIEKALEILNNIDHPFGEITIKSKYGQWYYAQNKFDEALNYFEMCKDQAAKIGDERGLAVALTNCGIAYQALGNQKEAIKNYNKSLQIDREIGNLKSEAMSLGNIGRLYHMRGDFGKALDLYQKSFEIGKSLGSKQIQSLSMGNLAVLYQLNGERERALDSHKEALDINRRLGFVSGEVLSLFNVASWYHEDADYDKAIEYFDNALILIRDNGLEGQEPHCLLNMSLSFHYKGELERAQKNLVKASNLAIKVNSKIIEDYSRRYLGFVLIDLGELEKAEKQFKTAESIASSIGSKVSIASAKIGLGWIDMIRSSNHDLIVTGIDEAKKLGDTEMILKGQTGLAMLLIEQNSEPKFAKELLESARELAESSGYKCENKIIDELSSKLK